MNKFVCLEGIEEGNRFFSSCEEESEEHAKLYDGTVAYKILGYADTPEKAREILHGPDHDTYENRKERFKSYLTDLNNRFPMFSEEDIEQQSEMLGYMDSREKKEGKKFNE